MDEEKDLDLINSSDDDSEALDGLEEKDGVKYETNDNWQFEAEASSLNDNVVTNDNLEIDFSQNEKKQDAPVAEKVNDDNASNQIVIDKTKLKIIPLILAILIVAGVLIFLGVRYYTVPNGKEGKMMNPGSVVATINDTDVSIGLYNYYYTSVVSYYESYAGYGYYTLDTTKDYAKQTTQDEDGNTVTWLEFFQNEAMSEIQRTVAGYSLALKEGITLTDIQKENIDKQIENLKSSASEASMSLNDYLEQNFGDYCKEDTIRLMLEQYYMNANYKGKYYIEQKIDDKDISEYYENNKNDYYSINFSYLALEYDSTSDESKAASEKKAKDYMNKIKDRKSIADLVPEVYKEFIETDAQTAMASDETLTEKDAIKTATETYMANIDGTITGSSAPFGDDINNWLFSDDTAIGSKNYYIDEEYGYIYVLLKTEMAERLEDETYFVRHILICPDIEALNNSTDGSVSFTDDQWKEAKEKADKILKEYNDGDKSEYSFAVLAEKNSDDTASTTAGSSDNFGGICKEVGLGQMVPEFEKWSTDKSRKYGDVDIVKSDYGYHIMFFINDCPKYEASIITAIRNDRINKFIDDADVDIHKTVMKKAKVAEPAQADSQNTQTAQ